MTDVADARFVVHHGDNMAILPTLADCSVETIVTDPPTSCEGSQAMPIEYLQLRDAPLAIGACPTCGQSRPDFMRGQVQSTWRRLLRLPYCAVICHRCKEIIGWEKP